jgi:two-component system sensor histidine kinase BaeS
MNYIFDRLYRVEQSRNRALGGSGLGLSIARQIITQHGGTIEAFPSALGGLKIKIELPLYEK